MHRLLGTLVVHGKANVLLMMAFCGVPAVPTVGGCAWLLDSELIVDQCMKLIKGCLVAACQIQLLKVNRNMYIYILGTSSTLFTRRQYH